MLKQSARLLVGLAVSLLPLDASSQQSMEVRGQQIAIRECARCHSVTQEGESPHKDAPPFRSLSKKYPVEHLAEALAEGIVVGHKDMPEFLFEPDDVEALLTYIARLAN
jgi:mono/diheme cytochrome c family protein